MRAIAAQTPSRTSFLLFRTDEVCHERNNLSEQIDIAGKTAQGWFDVRRLQRLVSINDLVTKVNPSQGPERSGRPRGRSNRSRGYL